LRRLISILLCLLFAALVFGATTLGQRYPLGIMPTSFIKVENSSGTFYVVLVKGDSELIVFDSTFKPLTILDAVKNDGVNDILYKDGKLYCFGFFSGRLIVIDASGYPGRWKKIDEIPTSSRLITGVFLDGKLGMLSSESEFIVLDTSKREIVQRYKLPVMALSIIEDSKYFYVSLFYNYSVLNRSHETEKGLLVFDANGKLVNSMNIGKRPSYMLSYGSRLFLVSYVEEAIKVLSKEPLSEMKSIDLGRYPNHPTLQNGKIWIPITGEDRIVSIDPDTYLVNSYSLIGKGPIKVAVNGNRIYVLETITGTLEILDEKGNSVEIVKLDGYPVDIAFSGRDIAVLLQEDWKTGKNTGALMTLKTN